VTIVDIAREAGVSASTVSRVLTGSVPVAEQTEAAVRKALAQLDYRPNLNAQHLVRGRSMAIGVLTQHPASSFFGELVTGVELGLRDTPYHSIYASGHRDRERELETLNLLLGRRVDGVIVLGGSLPDDELRAVADVTPLIAVGRSLTGRASQRLRIENADGARSVTHHLLQLGHRRIAHLSGAPSQPDARERLRGYREALAEAGVDEDPDLVVEGTFETESGLEAVTELLRRTRDVTAVFAANDNMAWGAQLGLHRHSLRVPEDISLAGFDDHPFSAFATPPLTTVRQAHLEIGQAAARGMLRLLDGKPPRLPAFRTELVVRESTAPPRPRRRREVAPAPKRRRSQPDR
jgi:LacI family transcriptional regulator